jgi:hypothetical protein
VNIFLRFFLFWLWHTKLAGTHLRKLVVDQIFPCHYNPRMTKTRVFTSIFASLLLIGGIAIAEQPAQNVSKGKHPNIAAAQRLTAQAFEKITAAQEANEWDMQGHAKKAKELLDEANKELKQAAQAANKNAK